MQRAEHRKFRSSQARETFGGRSNAARLIEVLPLSARKQVHEGPCISSLGRVLLVVAAGEDRAERVGIDSEDHENVYEAERNEQHHRNEMPVSRPDVSTQEVGEECELHRFPDRYP